MVIGQQTTNGKKQNAQRELSQMWPRVKPVLDFLLNQVNRVAVKMSFTPMEKVFYFSLNLRLSDVLFLSDKVLAQSFTRRKVRRFYEFRVERKEFGNSFDIDET